MGISMFDIRQVAEMVAQEAAKEQTRVQGIRKQQQQDLLEGLMGALRDLQGLDRQAEEVFEQANAKDTFSEVSEQYEKARAITLAAFSQLQLAHERVLAAKAKREWLLGQHEEAVKDLRREVGFYLRELGVTEEQFKQKALENAETKLREGFVSEANKALADVDRAQRAEAKCQKWVAWKVWAFHKARYEFRQEVRPTVVGFGTEAPHRTFLGEKLQEVVG